MVLFLARGSNLNHLEQGEAAAYIGPYYWAGTHGTRLICWVRVEFALSVWRQHEVFQAKVMVLICARQD